MRNHLRQDTFISSKKRTFAHKSDSITIFECKIVIESDLRANVHFFALINYYKLSSRGASPLASLGLNKRSKVDFTVGNIYIYILPIFQKARPSFFGVLHTLIRLSQDVTV